MALKTVFNPFTNKLQYINDIAGALIYKGTIDCSTNPNYPPATIGDVYIVSVAGKIGGVTGTVVVAGDMIICNTDNGGGDQATVGADFDVVTNAFDVSYTNSTPTPTTIGGIPAGSTFNFNTMQQMWDSLLYPYIAPSLSLLAFPSGTLREYGNTVTNPKLDATTVKHTNNITSVKFYKGATLIDDNTPPAFPGGGLETFTYTHVVSVPETYTATATDGMATTTSNTITYSFCYPFYYGSGSAGLTGAQIGALTKAVEAQGNKTKAFAPVAQYYYYAYPTGYGALTAIYDQNGFNITADFTPRTVSITGLDGTAQTYRVYEFNNLTSLAQNLTFNF